MERKENMGVFVLVLWIMMMLIIIIGVGKADGEAPNKIVSETVKSAEAASSAPPNPNSYWKKVRKLVNKAYAYLFPPKIDFRPGKPVEDGGVSVNGNGNVKEAVTKSFQKTKEMVEDSAKAAAETLQIQQQQQPDSEL